MGELKYDWVVSQENRLASEECCLSEAEIEAEGDLSLDNELVGVGSHPEGDRALKPLRTASKDPLDELLERTYRLLNPPKFHAHYCSRCFHLRICYQSPCKYRATDLEREWECGCPHE